MSCIYCNQLSGTVVIVAVPQTELFWVICVRFPTILACFGKHHYCLHTILYLLSNRSPGYKWQRLFTVRCGLLPDYNGIRTHTHTRLTALFPEPPGWASTRKVKPIWILLKQETVSGSGISWAICKSAPRSRQITTPAPHHSVFLQAGCSSCHPTNSIKALKATVSEH